jgi:hypothetical protein
MKSSKEYLTEEEWGGKNTYWSKGKTTITLDQMIKATEHIPVVQIPITSLSTNPGWKPTSKIKPDMNYPILILNGKIIDGNHRLKYAKDFDIFYVSCKLFTTDDLPEEMQRVFS